MRLWIEYVYIIFTYNDYIDVYDIYIYIWLATKTIGLFERGLSLRFLL